MTLNLKFVIGTWHFLNEIFCFRLHWYLLIVCNHGMVLSAKRTKHYEEKREEQQKLESMVFSLCQILKILALKAFLFYIEQGGNPFIMVLDSMEGTHSSAVNKIRFHETKIFFLAENISKMKLSILLAVFCNIFLTIMHINCL